MKKQTALLTAFALLVCASAPAFAEEAEVPDTGETAVVCEASEGNAQEGHNVLSEDGSEDDIPTDEQPADTPSEDTTDNTEAASAENTLTDDEAEYMAGEWYTWDAANGVLTLRGQLPDTDFIDATLQRSLADHAGIKSTDIKKIVITSGTKAGTSAEAMFYEFRNLTEIQGLDNLDTSTVTNMGYMFCNCNHLAQIDLSGFNTRNVTAMNYMFHNCWSLSSRTVRKVRRSPRPCCWR